MRKWAVERLSGEDRSCVDEYLVAHDFHGFDDLVELMRGRGVDLGVSALKGYANRLRHRRKVDRMVAQTTEAALLIQRSKASS